MKLLVCFSGTRPDPWIDGLRAALPGASVSAWTPGAPPADYAVVWTPPQALLDEQPGLKAVFNIGAGVDALMALRLPPSARVVRLDDAGMSVQMAEYVCHAVIRHFREFDGYEADVRQGRWTFRKPRSRADWPVGVMGLGVLGSRVAQALREFEFPVNGWSRSAHAIEGVRTYAGPAQFHAFLAASRVLVNLLPLTPQTAGILNRDTLSRLLPGAFVINVARGAHLVDEDLLALLGSGQVAGATLDVFHTEPLPQGHPFWNHPKIRVTPHNAGLTNPDTAARQVVENLRRLRAGEAFMNRVDPVRGY